MQTPEGEARVQLASPSGAARGALVLGHGAGGGIRAPDLQAAAAAGLATGFAVALVEQPYRVAGRRAPPRAPRLDAAWRAVCAALSTDGELAGLRQITGGRSSGARVACRTAAVTGAAAVLCLAFPLMPPARRGRAADGHAGAREAGAAGADGRGPESRLPELDAVAVPTLVVQGTGDRFGMPPNGPQRSVVAVPGDHSLRSGISAVQNAVAEWLLVASALM